MNSPQLSFFFLASYSDRNKFNYFPFFLFFDFYNQVAHSSIVIYCKNEGRHKIIF